MIFKSREEREEERRFREEAEREAKLAYRRAYIEEKKRKAREKARRDATYGGIAGFLSRLATSDVAKNWGKGLQLKRRKKRDFWDWEF